MKKLEDMVGETIGAIVPTLHERVIQRLVLHGVEPYGIWVESQTITDMGLELVGLQSAPKTMIVLLPWDKILMIFSSLDVPSLSEKRFGIT
jgi:hypothetical protein